MGTIQNNSLKKSYYKLLSKNLKDRRDSNSNDLFNINYTIMHPIFKIFNKKLVTSNFILIYFVIILCIQFINCKSNLKSEKLKSKVEISQINKTIIALQLGANNPCEDKYFIKEITISNKTGYIMAIFDGHGGWILSQYANLLFYPYFLEEYNSNKNIEKI